MKAALDLHNHNTRRGHRLHIPRINHAFAQLNIRHSVIQTVTNKGQENSSEENQIGGWVGQEGERRKSYSAAVIDGIKRNSRIYVGDSVVRKTDTRLSKEEDVVVCLPGARIEHRKGRQL